MENSILLYGKDVRNWLQTPDFQEVCDDVRRHYETIRKYAKTTGRSLYSLGWMLDIARCIYTLRTGKVIAKTEAGKWALQEGLCPDPEVLEQVLAVREWPLKYTNDSRMFDFAETLGEPVQRFADVLEAALVANEI